MTWLDGPLLSLDSESTGLDVASDRLLTLCIGRSERAGDWTPATWKINPGIPIPAESTAVHGIADPDVADWTHPGVAVGRARSLLSAAVESGTPVVIYNAPFDLSLIDAEMRRHLGQGLPDGLVILDCLCLYRRFDWRTGGRSLTKLAARHGITFPAHDAEADALASLRLLHILADANDALPLIPAGALHEAQRGWWVQQQDAAEAHAHGNGTQFTRQDSWPLIPAEVTR